MPGTLTGSILALSRAIGETAPLIVIGAAVSIFSTPHSLGDPFSALPLMTFTWVKRPQAEFREVAAAASLVLLGLLLALNSVAIFLRNRFTVKWQ
jgi:phosphate transport system permease protein